MDRLTADRDTPGAFWVRFGPTSQSWVDPERPDALAFEYVQHTAILLDRTILDAPAERRVRVVHIGGAGMSIPRWVAWRRPGTAQVVCEPDTDLTAEVRRKIPLPPRSGIKVRDVDGRTGLAAMPADWADAVIVDAFDGAQVPGELATAECLDDISRVLRGDSLVVFNVTDRAPFPWAKSLAAGIVERWPHTILGMEPVVHKGKRFGNVVLAGAARRFDARAVDADTARLDVSYRWVHGRDATAWPGGATAMTDDDPTPSPGPTGVGW